MLQETEFFHSRFDIMPLILTVCSDAPCQVSVTQVVIREPSQGLSFTNSKLTHRRTREAILLKRWERSYWKVCIFSRISGMYRICAYPRKQSSDFFSQSPLSPACAKLQFIVFLLGIFVFNVWSSSKHRLSAICASDNDICMYVDIFGTKNVS